MIHRILVTGATGNQGSATVRELLSHGFQVKALTRSAASPAAQQLAAQGAELVEGDWGNLLSVKPALENVDAVFMVLPPVWNMSVEEDNREADLGIAFIDMAKEAGVAYLVYSSVMQADVHATFRPRFKHTIEAHLWASGLKGTVIRPAGFMENLLMPTIGIAEGKFYNFMPQHKKAPYITTEDIGVFARVVFQHPERYIGKTMNIAGDELDVHEIQEALEGSLGKKIELVQLPKEVLVAQNPLFAQLVDVLANADYPEIDWEEMRGMHPKLRTLRMWLEEGGKEKLLK